MPPSIEDARARVESAVLVLIQTANSDEKFAEFESIAWGRLLALGRAVVELFLVRRALAERDSTYSHAGARWWPAEWRTTDLGTRFGKVGFARRVGRRTGLFRRGKADLRLDRTLGLVGGFSLGAATGLARLCAQMAFAQARATMTAFFEWAPSPRATLRILDAIGGHARAFLSHVPAPKDDGEVLVAEVDGGGAPAISSRELRRRRKPKKHRRGRRDRRERRRENPRPRRGKGKKSKNSKVAFVGVLFTLKRRPDGTMEGPINKRMIATFESHRALFEWLHREAVKRGYGTKRTVFIADGSDHIWKLQQEFFPLAEPCIDWWHVVEYLWTAAGCLYGEGSPQRRAWVDEQRRRLRRGHVKLVLDTMAAAHRAIPKTGPGNKGRRERLLDTHEYLAEHQHRMIYAHLRRDDLDIASGVVEGAVRNLVRMRLDGPGMRWGRDRAEMMLHLRCVLLNGEWQDFERYLARQAITLAANPKPTRTHDAKPNAPLAEAA
jgi:hypothetical protein